MSAASKLQFSLGSLPSAAIPPLASAPALFDGWSILLAHVLGGPLGSCTVMAMNFYQLGKRNKAAVTFGLGCFLSVAILLPLWSGSGQVWHNLLATGAVAYFAKGFQMRAVRESLRTGARLRSIWLAAGIGFVSMALSILLVLLRLFS